MDAITLTDLAAVIGAVLGPVLLFSGAMMRYQHLDSVKTRDLIEESSRENRRLIEESNRENRRLIEESNRENRELIGGLRGELREVGRGLGDTRERLARIEGRLRVPPPKPQVDDGDNAEAA